MKKQYKYILGTLLLFLSSCNNQSTNSSSIINDDNSSSSYEIEIEQEGNLHIGGDETKKPAYEYKKQTSSFTRKSFTFNNTLIKYIENPNSKITSSTVTTEIYDVSVEALSTTQAYKDGYHSILYTPDFYFAYTNSTDEYIDYIAIHNGLNYIVNEINEKGNSYIPLNGVVLSIPKDLNLNIDIGDTLKVEANIYKHALINQDNARLTFEAKYLNSMPVIMRIDVTTGDKITYREIEYSFDLMLEDRKINVWSYNVETVLAEKFEAIIKRGVLGTRIRDFYDVHMLLKTQEKNINKKTLKVAINYTAEHRKSENDVKNWKEVVEELENDDTMMNQWRRYQKNNFYAEGIEYEDLIESIRVVGEIFDEE